MKMFAAICCGNLLAVNNTSPHGSATDHHPRSETAAEAPYIHENIGHNNFDMLHRSPRYAIFPRTTEQQPITDDVTVVKQFDFSCMNDGNKLSYPQILRQIAKTLQQPVTMMTVEGQNIDSWKRGKGCPSPEDTKDIIRIAERIDAISSLILTLLPGSKPLSTAQYIIGPLLEKIANDWEGIPTTPEQEIGLMEQMVQQVRFSIVNLSHTQQSRLKDKPVARQNSPQVNIPLFHLKDGINHINLEIKGSVRSVKIVEHKGKIFGMVPIGKKGLEKKKQIYFSHIAQHWRMLSDGKFNRFSKPELRLAHQWALEGQYHSLYRTKEGAQVYRIRNPHAPDNGYIEAIEMCGKLVPYHQDPVTGKHLIYDASQSKDQGREVVYVERWWLKTPVRKNRTIESRYSSTHGGTLDGVVIKTKSGVQLWAQIDRETGLFTGQRFRLAANGHIVPIGKRKKFTAAAKVKGNTKIALLRDKASSHDRQNDAVNEIKPSPSIHPSNVMKRQIAESSYFQFYTSAAKNGQTSETLVVSAHGGFIDSDILTPVVVLPSDITIKMLTPHETYLRDPGLDSVVNAKGGVQAYMTFTNGKVTNVEFASQEGNTEWKYRRDYNAKSPMNTLGREDGLQNYRHYRYEGESDEHIAQVLQKNRELSEKGEADLTDILTVSPHISTIGDTSLQEVSLQKIIDLDRSGKLVNQKGERYKTIVFSHCRNNFLKPDNTISTYIMEPIRENEASVSLKGTTLEEIRVTQLHRQDVSQEFEMKTLSAGRFIFTPVSPQWQSTTPPTPPQAEAMSVMG